MMNPAPFTIIDTKSRTYETLRTTPFPYLHPSYDSTLALGTRLGRHPNGNRESIGGNNESKEWLISDEEAEKFNRNSVATEYLSDDAKDKARERTRCAALGAIGSEMGYGRGHGSRQELREVEEGEDKEDYLVYRALDSCGTDTDAADCGQKRDNDNNEDGLNFEATTGPGNLRVEGNGTAIFHSGEWTYRHCEEAPTLIQAEMSSPDASANDSYPTCETFQHGSPSTDQGKARRNCIPHAENFRTVSGALQHDQALRKLDPGGETPIAISRHEFSYSLDFPNFLNKHYNSTCRDSNGSWKLQTS